MNIVTGAFGFVGSHLAEFLLSRGEDVAALSHPAPPENNYRYLASNPEARRLRVVLADVRSLDALKLLFRSLKPEVVYHLAALASHRLSLDNPYPYLETNITTVLNVLEAARVTEPSPRIIFSSSSSVYGDNSPPLREDMKPMPKGPYALSKSIGEELCMHYNKTYGVDCVVVRYFNVVGERCRSNIVLRIFADRIVKGEDVEVYGRIVDGVFKPAVRDFTYVGDVVKGTVLAAERGRAGEVYNIGYGRPVSVLNIAYFLMKHIGRETGVVYKELKPHEALESYCDNSKAREELGWKPEVDVEETVKRYVRWYMSELAPR